MSDKQLHRHTTPIVILAVAVFMLAVAYGFYIGSPNTGYQGPLDGTGRALTTSVVQIRPAKNGLARVSLRSSTPARPAPLSLGQTVGNGLTTDTAFRALQQMSSQPARRPND